jgi:protein gp37
LNLKGIDWVIVGGESGANPRPMKPEWAASIRDQCEKYDTAFFFKQWGGRNKKAAGRELEGAYHGTFPTPKRRRPAAVV